MLVLTRKLNQAIKIGDPKKPEECIEITVVEVRGDQVRIGVQAPKKVSGAEPSRCFVAPYIHLAYIGCDHQGVGMDSHTIAALVTSRLANSDANKYRNCLGWLVRIS